MAYELTKAGVTTDPPEIGTYEQPDHAEPPSPGAARYHRSETLRHRARVPAMSTRLAALQRDHRR